MKKDKGSKGKKLFVKKADDRLSEDSPAKSKGTPDEGVPSMAEKKKPEKSAAPDKPDKLPEKPDHLPEKPARKNTVESDPWQQAFADDNTILIKRTVRSGQCIQFDGNVVVMGDVNPGSEIIAAGNVVVMGALRGVVHAGATGREDATVSAFKLQPTQLRIANHITRAPDGDYVAPEHPEIARIKDGVVVIETYQMGQDRQSKIG